jgi:hypothetical protein
MENLKVINDVSIVTNPIKEYIEHSLHIALERSDTNKDWRVFRYLLSLNREWLLYHLKMTQPIFDYNVYKLPKVEKDKVFNV